MNTLDFIFEKFGLPSDSKGRIDLPVGRDALALLFAELGFRSGAEIGVERGEYSEVLARAMPEAELHLIDAWTAYPGYRDHVSQQKLDGFHDAVVRRMVAFPRVQIHTLWSAYAATKFDADSLDFVFIDANHSFDFVVQDVIEWSKRVRPNGIVSGHDYFMRGSQHQVPLAVNAYVEAHGISPLFICRGDHSPSWFYVRQ